MRSYVLNFFNARGRSRSRESETPVFHGYLKDRGYLHAGLGSSARAGRHRALACSRVGRREGAGERLSHHGSSGAHLARPGRALPPGWAGLDPEPMPLRAFRALVRAGQVGSDHGVVRVDSALDIHGLVRFTKSTDTPGRSSA